MTSLTLYNQLFSRSLLGACGGLLSAMVLASSGFAKSTDESRMKLDAAPDHEMLLKYTPHFTAPAKGTEFVMPVGSGDLSAMVSFDTALQIHLSKSDWLGRTSGSAEAEQAHQTKICNMSPGHVTVELGNLAASDIQAFDQYMDFGRGSVVVRLTTSSGIVEIEVFGEMTQKSLIIQVTDHRDNKGETVVKLIQWRPAMQVGSNDGVLHGEEINPGEPDKIQADDPIAHSGLGVAIGSPLGSSKDGALVIAPDKTAEYDVMIAAEVTRDGAPLQAATTKLKALLAADRNAQRQEQLHWWQNFWDKSWIELTGDKDAEYLTRLWLTNLYTYAGVFGGKLPPAFNCSSLLVMRDYSSWTNIYTFQNTRELIWPMWAANHPEYSELYLRNFDHYYEFLRKRVLGEGKIGLRLPENINISANPLLSWKPDVKPRELTPFDPTRIEDRSNQKFEEKEPNYLNHYLEEGSELSHLMLDHVRFTGDEAFLKDVCAPWIHECTIFYLNYLKQGQDGLWHMEPSDAAESWWKCRDPGIDMCALRHIFGVVVRDGKDLGFEPGLIELTRNRLEHLAPIPLGQWLERHSEEAELPGLQQKYPKVNPRYWGKKMTVFNGIDQTKDEYCIAAGITDDPLKHNLEDPELYLVYPYNRAGLASPHDEFQRALNTFNDRVCVNSYGWSPDGIWSARLGLPDTADVILQHAQKNQRYPYGGWNDAGGKLTGTTTPNLVNDTPQLDTAGVNMTAIQEMLLQSYDLADEEKLLDGGPIRLLPAIRSTWSGRFKLLAQGGFLVECVFSSGQVTEFRILSERGRMLRLINPWTGKLIEKSTRVGETVVMEKP